MAREFIQHALQPDDVAAALRPLLDTQSAERARMLQDLDGVRRALGAPGAAKRVALIARDLAEGRTA